MEEGTWGEDYYTNQCDGTQYNGIQIHKYTEIQIHKYTNTQIYKYNTNTLINAMESWKKQPHQCNDPRHIVEIIQRIETWIFCVFKADVELTWQLKKIDLSSPMSQCLSENFPRNQWKARAQKNNVTVMIQRASTAGEDATWRPCTISGANAKHHNAEEHKATIHTFISSPLRLRIQKIKL